MQAIPQNQQLLEAHGFSRGGGGADREENAEEEERETIDPEAKQAFIRHVYLYGIVFVLFSSISWMIVSICHINMFKCPVPDVIWFLVAVISLCILCWCRVSCMRPPVRWVLTVIAITCLTIFGSYFLLDVRVSLLLGALCIAIATMVVLHAYGALCPQACLPGIIITGCVYLVGFLVLLTLLIVFWFIKSRDVQLAFYITLFIAVVVGVPFQAQHIHGRGAYTPMEDALGCALNFYMAFGLILICINHFYNYNLGK